MNKILILGGTGFVGRHLFDLLKHDYKLFIFGSELDVSNKKSLLTYINNISPDIVIFLSSVTSHKESFDNQEKTYRISLIGLLNLFEVLNETNFSGKVLNVSSSEIYGMNTNKDLKIDESTLSLPATPYAVAKRATELLCYQWSLNCNFKIITARPFNHIGPGQSERFAISNFAKQLILIKKGSIEPILYVGNIDNARDFTDVRDVVQAYRLLIKNNTNSNIYNICSGNSYSLRCIILKMCKFLDVDVNIRVDSSKIRIGEPINIVGDPSLISNEFGWYPCITMDKTLFDIINYWKLILLK